MTVYIIIFFLNVSNKSIIKTVIREYQFIPSSFTTYSVDFNQNGVREPYNWDDVLGSIANYLRMNGYKKNSKNYDKSGDIYKAIFAYNHADNYVKAVLALTGEIKKSIDKK